MRKAFIIFVILVLGFGFSGCRNATRTNYYFHFYVDGGNGKIQVEDSSRYKDKVKSCNEHKKFYDFVCVEGSFFNYIGGGSNSYREQTFIAIPDEGYKVKEWIFNGKVVEGNTSESFVAKVTSEDGYHGMIIVKFEKVTDSK